MLLISSIWVKINELRLCWKHPSLITRRKFARCTPISKYECSIDFTTLLQRVYCVEFGPKKIQIEKYWFTYSCLYCYILFN